MKFKILWFVAVLSLSFNLVSNQAGHSAEGPVCSDLFTTYADRISLRSEEVSNAIGALLMHVLPGKYDGLLYTGPGAQDGEILFRSSNSAQHIQVEIKGQGLSSFLLRVTKKESGQVLFTLSLDKHSLVSEIRFATSLVEYEAEMRDYEDPKEAVVRVATTIAETGSLDFESLKVRQLTSTQFYLKSNPSDTGIYRINLTPTGFKNHSLLVDAVFEDIFTKRILIFDLLATEIH